MSSRDWTQEFRIETFPIKRIVDATNRLAGGRVDFEYRSNFTMVRRLALIAAEKERSPARYSEPSHTGLCGSLCRSGCSV